MSIRLNPGQDGDLLATVETAGGEYQQIAIAYLASGIPVDVDTTNKLPVVMDLSTLATHALQTAANTKLDSIITDLALKATEVTVATLGTEATLATMLTESTFAAYAARFNQVLYDGTIPIDKQDYLQVALADSPGVDAFGRQRVSEVRALFTSTSIYDKDGAFDEQLGGGGTAAHNPNHSSVDMRTTNSGDSVVRQTIIHIPYQPGKSQQAMVTFADLSVVPDVVKRVGLFDTFNGIFLESNGTNVRAVIRTETSGSPVDIPVDQASFNIDRLDGSGPSGVLVNWSMIHLLVIDYQWLGVGRVRMGLSIGGAILYFHEFNHSNLQALVFMVTPHLPVRYEITQSGANPAGLDQLCSSVVSESNFEATGVPQAFVNPTPIGVTNGGWKPLLSIRPKLLFNSLTNRRTIIPNAFEALGTTTNDQLIIRIVLGGTLTAPTWAIDPGAWSAAEIDVGATANAGGIVLASGMAGDRVPISLVTDILRGVALGLDIAGTHPVAPFSNQVTLECRSTAGTASAVASCGWRQLGA